MKLSVILLTWNSLQYVENCINSIYNSVGNLDFEIIAIDNGSKDGTPDVLKELFPGVRVVQNPFNRGVAPARNQGLREAKGDYILILDIDTVLDKDAIGELVGFLDGNPDVGVCGARLVFPDGTVQKSCRRFPLLHTKVLRRLDSGWVKRAIEGEYYSEQMKSGEPFYADYVIGACQLIRREALNEVGYLDDNIFYGPEDVDFCLRMWLNNWKVAYVPGALVTHYEQRITKKKLFSYIALKHMQGLVYYFIKHGYCFSRRGIYKRIRL